jgi:hypothetical protein
VEFQLLQLKPSSDIPGLYGFKFSICKAFLEVSKTVILMAAATSKSSRRDSVPVLGVIPSLDRFNNFSSRRIHNNAGLL